MGKQNAVIGICKIACCGQRLSGVPKAVRDKKQAKPARSGDQLHCMLCAVVAAGAKTDQNDLQMGVRRAIIYSVSGCAYMK